MNTHSTDILILGAGVAGCALAIMLRQRMPSLRVLLVDKSACQGQSMGETLPPGIRELMEPLGVWEAFAREGHLPAAGSSAVWGDPLRRDNPFLLQTSAEGWRIDKVRFQDFMLRAAKAKGAEVRLKHAATFRKQTPEGFQFDWQNAEGESTQLQAAYVVDATGRSAAFALRMDACKVRHDRLTAVWATYKLPQLPNDANSLVEACRDGWWYSAVFPGNRLVLAFMTDSDLMPEQDVLPEAWSRWLQEAPHTRARMKEGTLWDSLQLRAASTQCIEPIYGSGWLAVGDAAGTFDPLSSQGIYKAMKSGMLGAYALEDTMNGDASALGKYERIFQQDYQAHLETRNSFYQKELRWPQSPFWQRRHHWLHVHPRDRLVTSGSPNPSSKQACKHLSHGERAFVQSICAQPIEAQHVVQAYQHSPWRYKTSRNILVGIQHLLREEILQIDQSFTNTHFFTTKRLNYESLKTNQTPAAAGRCPAAAGTAGTAQCAMRAVAVEPIGFPHGANPGYSP